mmetsp:Transcript_86139/g.278281  ORF Transcript_86139/g.278281 Transcript_86139/m.278281 type:complete len:248 (+) Transcript_86139:1083-1826(+)
MVQIAEVLDLRAAAWASWAARGAGSTDLPQAAGAMCQLAVQMVAVLRQLLQLLVRLLHRPLHGSDVGVPELTPGLLDEVEQVELRTQPRFVPGRREAVEDGQLLSGRGRAPESRRQAHEAAAEERREEGEAPGVRGGDDEVAEAAGAAYKAPREDADSHDGVGAGPGGIPAPHDAEARVQGEASGGLELNEHGADDPAQEHGPPVDDIPPVAGPRQWRGSTPSIVGLHGRGSASLRDVVGQEEKASQ